MTLFTIQNQIAVKVLAIVTMLVMVASLVPGSVFAEAEGDTPNVPADEQQTIDPTPLNDEGNPDNLFSVLLEVFKPKPEPESKKITICKFSNGQGGKYEPIEVNENSLKNGLGQSGINVEDIIPPTQDTDFTNGQNWDTEGQAIYNNKCVEPKPKKESETIVVTGDTAVWKFNADPTTATPFAFNTNESSIGMGSLEVFPIGTTSADKMIATNILNIPVSDLLSVSYDYLIAGDGVKVDESQFYLNIYTNIDNSNNYYDCRFDYTPNNGVVGSFATASFDATDTPVKVAKRGSRIANCPATLAQMPSDSYVRFIALNVGDISASDTGLGGNYDNVVVDTTAKITTYDFEPVPKKPAVTVVASKIVCKDESDLPNWGNGGPDITATTAADWVKNSDGACEFASDWQFQYADQSGPDTAGDFVGESADYTTFDKATDANGVTTQSILLNKEVKELRFREVLQKGYIPFSKNNDDTVASAEFYCGNDVLNYDNWDYIRNPQAGETYNCVAWNVPVEVPEVRVCASGENLIKNGSFETTPPITANGGQWQIFSGGVVNWQATMSDGLEVWNNFNGTGAGLASAGSKNVELDGNDATRITQTISTIPGATYELRYDFSPRATIGASDNVMAVLVNGTTVETVNGDGTGTTTNSWMPKLKTFVATGTSTDIAFQDVGAANANGGYGPLLDNVSLCQVKEAPVCKLEIVSDTSTLVKDSNTLAVATYASHPSWTASIPGATWIWDTLQVLNPLADTTRTFVETFNIDAPTNATLMIAADNGYQVYINNVLVADQLATGNNFQLGTQDTIPLTLAAGANELKVVVKNFALSNSTYKTNPAGLLFKLTADGEKVCEQTTEPEPPKPAVTLNATKVVCNNDAAMPNGNITRPITAQTAADWVKNSDGACRLQTDWKFQWGAAGAGDGGNATIGFAPNYTTFGPTNANGFASTTVPLENIGTQIETREELKDGYVPFSSNLDAEFYCANDAKGTDNWEWIQNPINGETYNCVAFNMEKPVVTEEPKTYVLDGYKYKCAEDGDYYCYDGLSDWTVYATNGSTTMSTTTDENGYYKFIVKAGNWTVSEDTEDPDWKQVYIARNDDELSEVDKCNFEITDNSSSSTNSQYQCDFGNFYIGNVDPETFKITGMKWNDLDGQGDKDTTESGLAGWTIYAKNGDTIATTTTGIDGVYNFTLQSGDWTIYEENRSGWTQIAVTENGTAQPVVGEGVRQCSINLGVPSSEDTVAQDCTFFNLQNPVVLEPETPNNRSNRTGTRVKNSVTPQPLVLGAATSTLACGMYLQDYMRMGSAASTTQVTKLQVFLNAVGIKAPLTGIFDTGTDAAVRAFQAQYKTDVLTPWYVAKIVPHENPTGWVYQLTRWKINNIVCPGSEAYPVLN